LAAAEDDVLTYMTFPPEHWYRIYSTNSLERVNREVKHRTDVVGIFADADAVLRLVGSVLIEAHEPSRLNRSQGARHVPAERARQQTSASHDLTSPLLAAN